MTTATPQVGEILGRTDELDFEIPEVDQSRPPEIECLCPFCGAFNVGVGKPCGHCSLEDTNATRAATAQRLGPWFVLQTRNPSAPGMNFETLQALIRRQVVTSRSVVRGPTTGQLWRLASKVRGLSREFGQCYDCGEDIDRDEAVCPHCERLQTLPDTPEARGEAVEPAKTSTVESTHEPMAVPEIDLAPDAKSAGDTGSSEGDASEAMQPAEQAAIRAELDPITVMSSESADESPVTTVRAEHAPDRHIPKDDLLTARDVAKAFLLEFGPQVVPPPARVPAKPRPRDYRRLKTGVSLVGVLVAAAGIWPLGHVVAGWFTSNPGSVTIPQPAPTAPVNATVADVRLAGELLVPPVPATLRDDLRASTGKLDVAIDGDGYFHIKISPTVGDGTAYTRDGSLCRNSDGDLIVNAGSGYELIPPVNLPANATDITIGSDGVVQYAIAGTSVRQIAGQILLARFKNPAGLKHLTGSIYTETEACGLCWNDFPGMHSTGSLKQGFVNATAADNDTRPVVIAQAPVQTAITFQPIVFETKPSVVPPAPHGVASTPRSVPSAPMTAAEQELAPDLSPSDDPQTLLTAGMSAESTGDYAGAVAAYERIESLPSDQWPASLELRLKLARKELKGEVR